MKIDEKKIILIILVFTLSVLISPHLLRYKGNPYLISYNSYYHLRLAQKIKSGEYLNKTDELFFGGRDYDFCFVDILLSLFTDTVYFMKILPFIFGMLSMMLYYLILRKINLSLKRSFFTSLILLFSPVFIYTFTIFNEYFLIVFLMLLGSYLLLRENYVFSLLVFSLITIIDIKSFVLPLIVLIAYYQKFSEKRQFLFTLVLLGIGLIFIYLQGKSVVSSLISGNLFKETITDLGAMLGFGIFSLFLSGIGLLLSWKNKKKNFIIYLLIIILVFFSVYLKSFVIYLEFILVYYAGFAFTKLINLKWELQILKKYAILLILCGLFFSAGSYINRVIHFPPHPSEILSLEWLNSNSNEMDTVFSHYQNGNLIQAIAKRPIISDELYFLHSKEKLRIKDSDEIFYSRNLDKTESLLKKYNIVYIWINSQMKTNTWKKEDEGLLFLLKNSNKFSKEYDYEGIEIWKYTP
ncbi:hypothetical protein JXB41_00645 [Candidatus Woesearchaeota archaeon]|nr:hypothetical protein [Candidatus Woesearchaeota archaeon]